MNAPIAVLTPMANPTVEREFRALLPPQCDYVVGRLVSQHKDSEARLRAYAEELPHMLEQFGGLALSGVAFACTASSYLLGRAREDAIARELDLPLLWAAGAVRETLEGLSARKIAVISPYPESIHAAGLEYWRDSGIKVAFEARLEIGSDDTRAIYNLDGSESKGAISKARECQPDAILLSGTGMPTLANIDPSGAPPIISSNLCLAGAMLGLTEQG
ncbi:maleate cis-trans isomerase family protein [Altererythrobacter lutimaris]|uniref:Asp/Glu racemase n=1 Tax=Altererythrobacter lutimaris TaxID=2743979 RepID=A0A850HI13_9SPHN|nr:hypothetical protein [Altererythrobacter lutimaris]NVE95002.1 hypothetical protein [Altererythrobacter lutimaris]